MTTTSIVKQKPYRVRVGRMEELFITITAARQFARDLVKNHDHRGVAIYCQLITGEWVKFESVERELSIEEKQSLNRRASDVVDSMKSTRTERNGLVQKRTGERRTPYGIRKINVYN